MLLSEDYDSVTDRSSSEQAPSAKQGGTTDSISLPSDR